MYDTSIFKDIIKSSLNDSLVPLRNDVNSLISNVNDLHSLVAGLFISIVLMAIVMAILFYNLTKMRKRQRRNDAQTSEQITYALEEIVRLSEKDQAQNAKYDHAIALLNTKLSTLSEKVEGQAAKYDSKFIDLGNHLDKAINKAVDDLNS